MATKITVTKQIAFDPDTFAYIAKRCSLTYKTVPQYINEIVTERMSGMYREMLFSYEKLNALQRGVLEVIKAGNPHDPTIKLLRVYYLESGGALPEGD